MGLLGVIRVVDSGLLGVPFESTTIIWEISGNTIRGVGVWVVGHRATIVVTVVGGAVIVVVTVRTVGVTFFCWGL